MEQHWTTNWRRFRTLSPANGSDSWRPPLPLFRISVAAVFSSNGGVEVFWRCLVFCSGAAQSRYARVRAQMSWRDSECCGSSVLELGLRKALRLSPRPACGIPPVGVPPTPLLHAVVLSGTTGDIAIISPFASSPHFRWAHKNSSSAVAGYISRHHHFRYHNSANRHRCG